MQQSVNVIWRRHFPVKIWYDSVSAEGTPQKRHLSYLLRINQDIARSFLSHIAYLG